RLISGGAVHVVISLDRAGRDVKHGQGLVSAEFIARHLIHLLEVKGDGLKIKTAFQDGGAVGVLLVLVHLAPFAFDPLKFRFGKGFRDFQHSTGFCTALEESIFVLLPAKGGVKVECPSLQGPQTIDGMEGVELLEVNDLIRLKSDGVAVVSIKYIADDSPLAVHRHLDPARIKQVDVLRPASAVQFIQKPVGIAMNQPPPFRSLEQLATCHALIRGLQLLCQRMALDSIEGISTILVAINVESRSCDSR